jgi:uncharacterized protein
MRLNEIIYSEGRPVESYGPDFFRIDGRVIEGGILVLPDGIAAWRGYEELGRILGAASLIDVLFVGTGAEIAHIPEDIRNAIEETGIGVEIMASPAACRTYNVLLSEGRRIGLAALPV